MPDAVIRKKMNTLLEELKIDRENPVHDHYVWATLNYIITKMEEILK